MWDQLALASLLLSPLLLDLDLNWSQSKSLGSTFRVMVYTMATTMRNRLKPTATARDASIVMFTLPRAHPVHVRDLPWMVFTAPYSIVRLDSNTARTCQAYRFHVVG